MKKTGIYLFAAVLAIFSLTYGCGGGKEQAGVKLEWTNLKDTSLAGKVVTIEGYGELPLLMSGDEGRSTVNMTQRMNQYGGGLVRLQIKDGDGENGIHKLPGEYNQSDLLIHDKTGAKIVYGQKFRVTGKASIEYNKYTIEVETIEKIDEPPFDYLKAGAVRITDSLDLDKLDEKFVYAEGDLYVADEQSSGVRLEMDLDDETLSDEIMCKVKYGPINSQADDLPDEGYTSKDIVIRDNGGKKIGDGSHVRIYGVWYADKGILAVEQIVSLE